MYAAWRLGVDRRVLRTLMDAWTAVGRRLTVEVRSIGEAARRLVKEMEPALREALREQAVRDAVAREQEFNVDGGSDDG